MAAAFLGGDEAGLGQNGKMRGEGALRQSARRDEISSGQSRRLMPDEKPKGVQAGGVRKRCKRRQGRIHFHATEITDVINMVKMHREYPMYPVARAGSMLTIRTNTGLAPGAWLSEKHHMRSRAASPFQTLLRRAGLPAVMLIAIGFFGYNAVLGPTGVMQTKLIKAEYEQKQADYAALDKQRAALKNRVELLDQKRGVDPDLADELARKQLNVVRPDEVVIPLQKHGAATSTGR